jgi:hypothetical protein
MSNSFAAIFSSLEISPICSRGTAPSGWSARPGRPSRRRSGSPRRRRGSRRRSGRASCRRCPGRRRGAPSGVGVDRAAGGGQRPAAYPSSCAWSSTPVWASLPSSSGNPAVISRWCRRRGRTGWRCRCRRRRSTSGRPSSSRRA